MSDFSRVIFKFTPKNHKKSSFRLCPPGSGSGVFNLNLLYLGVPAYIFPVKWVISFDNAGMMSCFFAKTLAF
jgi:hypothetical protein